MNLVTKTGVPMTESYCVFLHSCNLCCDTAVCVKNITFQIMVFVISWPVPFMGYLIKTQELFIKENISVLLKTQIELMVKLVKFIAGPSKII